MSSQHPADDVSEDTAERPAVTARRERAGLGIVLVVVAVLALLVGAGWAAAYLMAGDRLPRGTTVAGVAIGDLEPAAAERRLRDRLAERLAGPVAVTAGGRTETVTPAEAGLDVDYAATVAEAGAARSWDPRRLWDHYTRGDEVEPVVTVDEEAFAKAQRRLDGALGTPPRDGAVTFGRQGVQTTGAVVGRALDHDALRAGLVRTVTATTRSTGGSDTRRLDLRLTEAQPDIDQTDVDRAVDTFANPAMSGPVTLVFGESPVELRPAQYAGALALEPHNGTLEPTLDQEALSRLVSAGIAHDANAPVDATVRIVRGRPRVVPARPGVSFDPAQVASTFLTLVTRPEGQRRAAVTAKVADPEISTADARAWRIREKVSSFTTYFPYAEYRNTNIGRAAALVDGTVLKPGDTFSLNDTVGERTRENGFTEGWTIQNGVFYSDLGGGVSQMATTTFNAMFFAGLEDVEHKPHSLYISRYPVGREATVAWGSVDLRFTNDTPYGVLITTSFTRATPGSQGSVTVSMWSTKVWDITTRTGPRYAQTAYKKRTIRDTNCEATVGAPGFDVDVWRYFHKPGSAAVVRTEKFHTRYIPQDEVTCAPPPQAQRSGASR